MNIYELEVKDILIEKYGDFKPDRLEVKFDKKKDCFRITEYWYHDNNKRPFEIIYIKE